MTSESLQQNIKDTLKQNFGFDSLRGNQQEAIETILQGKDCLNIMPTGGGKSLCYQLPAMMLDGLCVVVSPLISLMQDQVENLNEYGIPSAFLNSSLSLPERNKVEEDVENENIKILFVAPEGLLTFNVMSLLKRTNISMFAIDEAHCVSQWGHEFRSDYRRLGELKEHFPVVPCIALTATADKKTREDIVKQLHLNDPKVLVSSFDRPNIQYRVYEKQNEIKQLTEFIQKEHQDHTGIVYCLSRSRVEKVTEELKALGFNALSYHAGMTPKKREKNLERFRRDEAVIVVATIAFGMGIDRPDVRFVAHLDLPKSIEGYYQETGRAGRDGKPSTAWMVYGLSDVVKLARMIEQGESSQTYKQQSRLKLDNMLSICESMNCRRQSLLEYFGEELPEPCGNCDACLEPMETWDASVACQMLLSTIYRTGQKFGAGYIVDVLRGSNSAKIKERFDHELSVYGIGKDISKSEWNSIIRQLLCMGYIHIINWEYRSLGLTEACRPILRGELKIELKKLYRSKSKNKSKSNSGKAKDFVETDNPELFERLRVLRMNLAKEHKVPPYIVFGDKSLHDMCWVMPETKEQMLSVHGVGESKWERYGELFLQEIASYIQEAAKPSTSQADISL